MAEPLWQPSRERTRRTNMAGFMAALRNDWKVSIGQDWGEGDVRIILFVVLGNGISLDEDLATRIKSQIRRQCTPHHVPAKVVQVADIPRTKSGKITELAVCDRVHGRKVKNTEALANPEALEFFKNLAELRD